MLQFLYIPFDREIKAVKHRWYIKSFGMRQIAVKVLVALPDRLHFSGILEAMTKTIRRKAKRGGWCRAVDRIF